MAALICLEFSKSQQAMGNLVTITTILLEDVTTNIFLFSKVPFFSVVSLLVMSDDEEIFKKESLIERRELRLLTKVSIRNIG